MRQNKKWREKYPKQYFKEVAAIHEQIEELARVYK